MNKQSSRDFDSFAGLYENFVTLISGTPWLGWDDIAGENAIDIGCGAGQTTEIIAKKFGRVIGLDISDELIKLAKAKHAANNISYIKNDVMTYEDTRKYDYVYSHTMMHHLENYEIGLERIKGLVKKGGKLVIIDNVSDTYVTPPRWAYTVPAKIEFIPNVFRIGIKKAWFLLRFWHNKKWLGHLASDKYLSRTQFREKYIGVFPGAEIVDLGYANAIKWINE